MIKKILKNDFLKNNIIFFLGTLAFSFFNYLYYPIISRLLPVSSFGEVQSLITLYMQLGVIFTSFGYLIVNVRNNHLIEEEKDIILTELERLALVIAALFSLLLVILSPLIASVLQYSNPFLIMVLAPLIVVTVPYTFRLFYLQSHKKLFQVSIATLIYSIGKLLVAVVLILLGAATFGALWGYIISLLLAWVYLFYNTKVAIPYSKPSIPMLLRGEKYNEEKKIITKQLSLGGFIFLMLFGITFLYTADVLIIRQYFNPEMAGLYSGISTIARIIYFLTASVVGVLLASVSLKNIDKENIGLLKLSAIIMGVLGACGIAGFFLFPTLIIKILLGPKYISEASLLLPLGIAMLTSSYVNLFYTYQLSLRRYISIIPIILATGGFVLLTTINHGSLVGIVYDLLVANLFAFIIGIILIAWSYKWPQKKS